LLRNLLDIKEEKGEEGGGLYMTSVAADTPSALGYI